jgi:hypothetical protein
MATNIITPEDLQAFKVELLEAIEKLLSQRQTGPMQRWLKSPQVRNLLNLSPGTLQNLRINGTLPFSKIGGVIFYDYEDIERILQERKRNTESSPIKNQLRRT